MTKKRQKGCEDDKNDKKVGEDARNDDEDDGKDDKTSAKMIKNDSREQKRCQKGSEDNKNDKKMTSKTAKLWRSRQK